MALKTRGRHRRTTGLRLAIRIRSTRYRHMLKCRQQFARRPQHRKYPTGMLRASKTSQAEGNNPTTSDPMRRWEVAGSSDTAQSTTITSLPCLGSSVDTTLDPRGNPGPGNGGIAHDLNPLGVGGSDTSKTQFSGDFTNFLMELGPADPLP